MTCPYEVDVLPEWFFRDCIHTSLLQMKKIAAVCQEGMTEAVMIMDYPAPGNGLFTRFAA